MPGLLAVGTCALCYLIGSVSPAYILGRTIKGVDLREVGSRNLGARNAGRILGRWAGVLIWILDMAKGAFAVQVSRWLGFGFAVNVLCGALAVCGHNWPIFLGFRGGRGASTVMGATFVLLPVEMAIGLGTWVLVELASGSLYLGGLIAFPVTSVAAYLLGSSGLRALSPLAIALPLMVRHVPAVVDAVRTRRLKLP